MRSDFNTKFDVNLSKYIGLWYQAARTPNKQEDDSFMIGEDHFLGCYNVTSEYTLLAPNKFSFVNNYLRRSEQGHEFKEISKGIATSQENGDFRKFKLSLGSSVTRFFQHMFSDVGTDYWIYCLGPINDNDLYDWAVISGPNKDFIFFLTREQFISNEIRNKMLSSAESEMLPINNLIYRQGDYF